MSRYQQHVHTRLAERALGKSLPSHAVIHHRNGNGLDNRSENLIICQDQAYHLLIHQRQRAWRECGNPNYRKCSFCKKYDSVDNLYKGKTNYKHQGCANEYLRNWKAVNI